MNTTTLQNSLENYRHWMAANKVSVDAEMKERQLLIDKVQSYTKTKIDNITEEGLQDLLGPLWAMMMWGNKQYYINNIIKSNGLNNIRKHLSNLLFGTDGIENDGTTLEVISKVSGLQ